MSKSQSQSPGFCSSIPVSDVPAMANVLEESGLYRVTRKYTKPEFYCPDDGSEKLLGVFLDIETMGLDYEKDKIIELSMVAFTFSKDGHIFRLVDEFDQFEDPGAPIPEYISALTGIRDAQVKNQKINPIAVERFIEKATLVIAHNSAFDRPFVERKFPIFRRKPWACSMREVPWETEGIGSCKLEFLAYKYGFFYDGHRAIMDCLAGIHILANQLPRSGCLVFEKLLDTARRTSYRIWATGAPFKKKDRLKKRGYHWNDGNNGQPRSWFTEVCEDDLFREKMFLAQEIYGADPRILIEKINAFNRYSLAN